MDVERNSIVVWDPFVRVFHWSLVASYAVAWASAEEWDWLHEQSGYFILVLIGLRVMWGLVGTRHARFSDFIHGPGRVLSYLRDLTSGTPRHYLGHNPAGGWMVLALLVCLLATGATGMLITDGDDGMWNELHEGLANLSLVLVFVHVGGVLVASLLHGDNLIRAMWTGRKPRRGENV